MKEVIYMIEKFIFRVKFKLCRNFRKKKWEELHADYAVIINDLEELVNDVNDILAEGA